MVFFNVYTSALQRYNAPTASQVAAIWLEGNDPQRSFDRSVLVYARGDQPRYIKAYHGCCDPLSYPLFLPRGETGWNRFMPYNDMPTIHGNEIPTVHMETPTSLNVQSIEEPAPAEPTGTGTNTKYNSVFSLPCQQRFS